MNIQLSLAPFAESTLAVMACSPICDKLIVFSKMRRGDDGRAFRIAELGKGTRVD